MSTPKIANEAQQLAYEDWAPEQLIKGYPSFNDCIVQKVFTNDGSEQGVRGYALRNRAGDEFIIWRGSDPPTSDLPDWKSNLSGVGYSQWEDVQDDVMKYLGERAESARSITFVGHSLGGAISQYNVYDFIEKYPGMGGKVSLFTFDAPGGQLALQDEKGSDYNPSLLSGIKGTHFWHPDDLVPRIGGAHLGPETKRVPDPNPNHDGIGGAHTGTKHTETSLSEAKSAKPDYYQNFDAQRDGDTSSIELLNASGKLVSGGRPTLEEALRFRSAVQNFKDTFNHPDDARFLKDLALGVEAEAKNLIGDKPSDVKAALEGAARDAINKVSGIVEKVAQTSAEAAGAIIKNTAQGLAAAGAGGKALLGYFADSLDKGLAVLGATASNFSEAIRAQLIRLIDPIVLDLDGNGIELTGRLDRSIYFDMDGDGIKERTGWVSPKDGLLAIDENNNGRIDNINELIGDLGRSGFTELSAYDLNKDKLINASDAVFAKLRVWVDANSNAITDAGELKNLPSLNIKSIDLNYTLVDFTAEGNKIHEKSEFQYTNGVTGLAADIWFDVDNVATNSAVSLTGNLTIDGLPDIRGRGDVGSLRSAMSKDGALTTLVSGFVTKTAGNLGNARSEVEQILYRWAGVQSVNPASRGIFFDGRKLAALEAFTGTDFLVEGVTNPTQQAVSNLTAAWNGLVDGVMARLLMGGPVGKALTETIAYLPEIDRLLTTKKPAEMLAGLKAAAPAGDSLAVAGYWAAVLPLARETYRDVGGNPASPELNGAITAALADTGLAPFADLLRGGIVSQDTTSDVLRKQGIFRLTSGNDSLWLGDGRRAVYAGDGHDIVALAEHQRETQLLGGGAGNDQLYTGSANDWLDGGTGVDTVAGGEGNDTYVVDHAGDVVVEEAGEGEDHVRSSIAYNLGAHLEHLTLLGSAPRGTGNDGANHLIGNSAANRLEGLAGNDTLDGGAGNDTMLGGVGRDYYRVDSIGDVVIETGSDEDTVESTLNYLLGARLENLRLTGTTALSATGNELNNKLYGNSLANVLDGGAGRDEMYGGAGNDTYVVDQANDHVGEDNNAGVDLVRSSSGYDLLDNVEDLILTGLENVRGKGNALANRITGNTGHNTIDGGAGADTMTGGAGDDYYSVENVGDAVSESVNAGIDQVMTSLAAYTLGVNVERLRLYIGNWEDSAQRNGTGNVLHNEIVGNAGNNRLLGLDGNDTLHGSGGADSLYGGDGDDSLDGGAGVDRMEGGAGNDTYVVDQVTDVLVETAGAGTDTVESSVSWMLGANFENLTLTNGSGWSVPAIDGQGNASNNRLVGNSANNALDGGLGVDTMMGGRGNDTYTVDNGGDVVFELYNVGIDEVRSSIGYTLGAFVENLTLTGSSNVNATGNVLGNVIKGNAAANRLTGMVGNDSLSGESGHDTLTGCADLAGGGRSEKDTLTGGLGKDVFALGSAAGVFYDDGIAASNGREDYALITDFTVGEDSLRLRGAAKDYFLGASGEFWNEPGRGLYRDTNTNSSLDGSDELIAIVRSGNSTELTAANTIKTATFV